MPGTVPVVSSDDRHDEALVKSGGLVIGRKGTVGSVTLLDEPNSAKTQLLMNQQ